MRVGSSGAPAARGCAQEARGMSRIRLTRHEKVLLSEGLWVTLETHVVQRTGCSVEDARSVIRRAVKR